MKLATKTADFLSFTHCQIQALAHLRSVGFRYADYSFGWDHSHRCGIYADDPAAYYTKVAQSAEDLGIRLVQAHAPMGKPLDDPNGSFLADTIRCVEACGHWGIPNLVVHSGYLPDLPREETFSRNKDFFLPILRAAEAFGVNILVENFNKMYKENVYWIDNAADLLRMIETVDHPLFHAVWDTGHANLQKMPQNEELLLLGDHVKALHIQDNLGIKDQHLLPFHGTTDMDSVMQGLQAIGFKGYFTFEVGRFFDCGHPRRQDVGEPRLPAPNLELQDAAERYLYQLGRSVLEAYGCFEE